MQFLHERYTFYAFGHVPASGIYDLPSASILIYIFNLLESFDPELTTEGLETERLRAERFTLPDDLGIFDMWGVQKALYLTAIPLLFMTAGELWGSTRRDDK
jgi:hypothetical protein